MNLAILLPALLAGALFPVQSLINAQLARHVGHPITATLISVSVRTTVRNVGGAAAAPPPATGGTQKVGQHLPP